MIMPKLKSFLKSMITTIVLTVACHFQLYTQPSYAQPSLTTQPWLFHEVRFLHDFETFKFQELSINEILSEMESNPQKTWIYRERFIKAYPQILKIIQLRENLISILESYKYSLIGASEDKITLVDSKIQLLKDVLLVPPNIQRQYPKISPYTVSYEFGSSRFQAEGIPTTLLAVNTGYEIIFNGDALVAKNFMTEDLVQLWLHELFHFDKKTPSKIKDQWVAQLIEWLRSKTQHITTSSKETLTFISLPKSNPELIRPNQVSTSLDHFTADYYNLTLEQMLQNHLKSQLLLIPEHLVKPKLVDSLYAVLVTNFNQLIDQISDWETARIQNDPQSLRIKWPTLDIVDIKNKTDGSISFTLNMNLKLYEQRYDGRGNYEYTAIDHQFSHYHNYANLPNYRFTIDFNPSNEMISLKRDYTTHLENSQFEVNRIQDTKDKRYISLRLQLAQPEDKFEFKVEDFKILARDPESNQKLFFTPISYKIKSPQEILLHVEIPKSKLEIRQILIPKVSKSGLYSEIIFLPVRPQSIMGTHSITSTELKIINFTLSPKNSVDNKLIATIQLLSNKSVSGVTLELDHITSFYNVEWLNHFQKNKNLLGHFLVGRKYYISKNDIRIDSDRKIKTLSFQIPESLMSQSESGPKYTKHISWYYKFTGSNYTQTMSDTGLRNFTNVIIHFKDGTTERVSHQILPKRFTLSNSQEDTERKKMQEADLNFRLRSDKNSSIETTTIRQCQKLLK